MSSPQFPSNEKTTNEKSSGVPTIASQLTGPGRSAIAVIAIAGDRAADAIDQSFRRATPSPMLPGQIRYGNWVSQDGDGTSGESIVITPITSDHFEIHCHGGPAAVTAILSDLRSAGVTTEDANAKGKGIDRAINTVKSTVKSDTKPLLIQESEAVLIHCTTTVTAAIAMDQVRGAMQQWAIDCRSTADFSAIVDQAREMLTYAPLTTHLTEPFRVVLVGAPNVGKSSLTNAILGYSRSITMNTAGTTRDVLHAETVIDGIPIRISDTAGIRTVDAKHDSLERANEMEQANEIEREGIRRAIQEVETADLVIRLRAPDTEFTPIPEHIRSIDVMNKSDLMATPSEVSIAVSATTGHGIPELLRQITGHFSQHRPPPGAAAAINQRQAEILGQISAASTAEEAFASLSQLIGAN